MSLDDPAHTPNIVAYWEFLEAALRWQSENPQVPTEQQLSDMAADAHVCMDEVIAEWQRRMYLAPEPEVDRDEQLEFMVKCTSQYDETCRALAAELLKERANLRAFNKQYREDMRDVARDARDAAAEAYWQGKQGEDYGSF